MLLLLRWRLLLPCMLRPTSSSRLRLLRLLWLHALHRLHVHLMWLLGLLLVLVLVLVWMLWLLRLLLMIQDAARVVIALDRQRLDVLEEHVEHGAEIRLLGQGERRRERGRGQSL